MLVVAVGGVMGQSAGPVTSQLIRRMMRTRTDDSSRVVGDLAGYSRRSSEARDMTRSRKTGMPSGSIATGLSPVAPTRIPRPSGAPRQVSRAGIGHFGPRSARVLHRRNRAGRPPTAPRGPFPLTCGGGIDYVRLAQWQMADVEGRRRPEERPDGRAMAREPIRRMVAASECNPDMFSLISRSGHRPSRPRGPGLASPWPRRCASVAPSWDQVTKDDDVRFFPPDSPSVVGQDLLERGFPTDAASSQVVLICERPGRPADARGLRPMSTPWPAGSTSIAQATPELGFKKLDTHRTPVIGPRLLGDGEDGRARRC